MGFTILETKISIETQYKNSPCLDALLLFFFVQVLDTFFVEVRYPKNSHTFLFIFETPAQLY